MGFYGNITNTARTQFSFDRVFANRYEMDLLMPTDGIYAGRFVLVEYDNEATKENFPTFFINLETSIDGYFYGYAEESQSEISRIQYTDNISQIGPGYPLNATKGDIFFDAKHGFFYAVVGGKEVHENEVLKNYALFEKVASNTDSAYVLNFNIDKAKYNTSRGYDSTVWQKVYANNEEKYVMVAELNTVVPTFDITVDAPTLAPINPHFDVSSTDVYYKLHMQPHWGFRVAAAKNENESDEKVTWIKQQYNQQNDEMVSYYWDAKDEKWLLADKNEDGVIQAETLNGAIYYNKAGFDPAIETKSFKQDKIAIEPTGESGQKYNTHDKSNSMAPAKDIQELEIILPSLGNAVADMWNIVYGKGNESDGKRNTDISWNSLDGQRLATTKDGYQYNINNIETLAGCINSVHDLMGMIVDDKPVDAQYAEDNRIYWDNQKQIFVRKKKQYEYNELPFEAYTHRLINGINEDNYLPYTYYFKGVQEGEWVPDDFGVYQSGKEYYGRMISSNYLKTNKMCSFESNKYYYANGKNYNLETNNIFANDKKYFIISPDESQVFNFTEVYRKNKYYYSSGDNYYLETANTPSKNKYYIPKAEKVEGKPFKSGLYHYKSDKGFALYEGKFNPDIIYYILSNPDEEMDVHTFSPIALFDPTDETLKYYQLINNDYILTREINDNDYYTLITPDANNAFLKEQLYEPNKYYYLKNNDFLLGVDNTYASENTNYYILDPIPCVFYENNKYYVKNNNDYVIADSFIDGQDYYVLGENRYIKEDLKHSYAEGALWNNQVELVPYPVVLAAREVKYVFEELQGFAKNYNTIHGLILRLNYLLEDGDKNTRDTGTIQGALNYLNDIFAKFDALKPKTLLSVGANGRIYPTTWTTAQEEQENRWIYFDLDEVDHKLTIQHKLPGSADNATDAGADSDILQTFGRTFKIPEIEYDNMGHISNVKTHEVKMPIGSIDALEADGSKVLTGISLDAETGRISQTNTDIGNLKLKGFNTVAEGSLSTETTVNEAFGILENRIIAHEKELDTIVGEGVMKEAFDTLVEVSTWISDNANAEDANSLVGRQNALESRILALETLINSLIGKNIFITK